MFAVQVGKVNFGALNLVLVSMLHAKVTSQQNIRHLNVYRSRNSEISEFKMVVIFSLSRVCLVDFILEMQYQKYKYEQWTTPTEQK